MNEVTRNNDLSKFTSAELFTEIATRESAAFVPAESPTHLPEIIDAAFFLTNEAEPGHINGWIKYIFDDGSGWECYAPDRV